MQNVTKDEMRMLEVQEIDQFAGGISLIGLETLLHAVTPPPSSLSRMLAEFFPRHFLNVIPKLPLAPA